MRPSPLPRWGFPIAVLAFLLAAAPALAQVQAIDLALAAEPASFTLDPGAEGTAVLTISNGGNAPAEVALAAETTGPGWTAELSQDAVTVPAGGSTQVNLRLHAPAERDGSAEAATVTVTAQGAEALTGQFADTATTQVTGALAAAPPPPPPEFPWIPVTLAALVLAGLVAGAWWTVRQRETGIEVVGPRGPSEVRAGIDGFIPLEVRNVSNRPRIAKLAADEAPPGWAVGTNLTSVTLDPGKTHAIWLAVRPPIDAADASGTVVVRARPAEARGPGASFQVAIKVLPNEHAQASRAALERARAALQGTPPPTAEPGPAGSSPRAPPPA